ncbi:MAG: methyltransferase domain-containing protein [Pseudolabrys sp.]|nr:methyltransferase domain-containing protein [Pseudolabrys sp.]MDP2294908.1 methyltransferase domain-containing protein [Pseudolabrys sp.]
MPQAETMDRDLLAMLACPRDHAALQVEGGGLRCAHGHDYPVVDGIPVFLLAEHDQTIGVAAASLHAASTGDGAPLYLETLGLSDAERREIARDWRAGAPVDAAISHLVGATSGLAYKGLTGRLRDYPIPDLPLASGGGEWLLDVGCNWGRWSTAAARKGWRVAGIDPSLGALLAARRAFSATTPQAHFVCGDARHLPFKAGAFAAAFSYSVIQHFSQADAERTLAEIGRVLRPNGVAKIQMAHEGGLRARYMQARADDRIFHVRYWPLAALRTVFETHIGPAELTAEAFGGLGLLAENRRHLPLKARLLIALSGALKALARAIPSLLRIADSVYVTAIKRARA